MTDTDATATRIVVGVDGSEQSKQALRWAGWLAAKQGSSVEACMVWQAATAFEYNWTDVIGDWNPKAETEKKLTEVVDDVFGAHRPPQLNQVVLEGSPARALVEHAKHATVLVVGNRGLSALASLALGSVSVRCVEHASCPVMVIRGEYLPTEA